MKRRFNKAYIYLLYNLSNMNLFLFFDLFRCLWIEVRMKLFQFHKDKGVIKIKGPFLLAQNGLSYRLNLRIE